MSELKTNSFFWLPASALAALALTSLIVACASLSTDTVLPAATATAAQASTAAR